MPLIYRNIVPNVPLWQEGNGKLVFRDNALSARAAMTYSIRIHGTVEMDGAIAEAGLQSGEVDLTLSSSMPDYGSGTIAEWGGYNVALKTPAVTPHPVVWPPAEFIYVGDTATPVGDPYVKVAPYKGAWYTEYVTARKTTETYIVLPNSWYVGHTWDARLGNATWFSCPNGGVTVCDNLSDAVSWHGIIGDITSHMTLAVCHKASADSWGSCYIQIGSISIPPESIVIDPFTRKVLFYPACRYDADPWPSIDMRPGTDGISLSRVAPALDYENVGAVDLGIRLKVNYAS